MPFAKDSREEGAAGFTLVEMMIVMLIIAVLSAVAIPSYIGTIKAAREAMLKEDLHQMRVAIKNYTRDKGKAPQSLSDLVQGGYLKDIPQDPITRSKDSWVTDTDAAYYDINEAETGMVDVHSGSSATGSDGEPYSSW